MKRLRQGAALQLRMLPAAEMPKAPLEKELVDSIRLVAHRMGMITWSGRIFVHGHKPPYLPILGPGTPDILGIFRDGRLWGVEAKRDSSSKERDTQKLWRLTNPGVLVCVARTVEEAVAFWKEKGTKP